MKRLLVLALAVTGILAAGCIVRFGTLYEDASDTSHFVGLASNLSTIDVVAASVRVDFYDSGNHLLDTEFVSPCTRTLQVKKDSPFEAIAPTGMNANHVQTTVYPLTLGKKTVADLDVDEDDITITTTADEVHIEGTVDVGDDDLYAVHVCAALFDNDDNVLVVGSDTTSPADIDEGDSGTFDVAIDTSDIDIDDIDQFELWVDALVHNPNDVTAPVIVGPDDVVIENTPTPTRTATPTPTVTPTPP